MMKTLVMALPAAALLGATIASAQQAPGQLIRPMGEPGIPVGGGNYTWVRHGPEPAAMATFDAVMEGGNVNIRFEGAPVKGAPYSADAVTEIVQKLSDGNRIRRENRFKIYRDGEGRTRREESLSSVGPWSTDDEPRRMIFVTDPQAGVHLVIDPQQQTVRKMPMPHLAEIRNNVTLFQQGEVQVRQLHIQNAGPPDGHRWASEGAAVESLGTRVVEGVECEGTRRTAVIPAGQVGNEREIRIVSERWYSPELQTEVLTTRSDPRFGETTYRLTNVQRSEPLPTLFEAPAGYQVEEGANAKRLEELENHIELKLQDAHQEERQIEIHKQVQRQ
jgi:hypothetical protein